MALNRVKNKLIQAYIKKGGHSKEEIEKYTAQVREEIDKKSIQEVINEYKHIINFGQITIDRAN